MADATIVGYVARLDEIAQGIADSVNALHREGFGLDGSTGGDFFDTTDAGTESGAAGAASRIRIAQAVAADPAAIAASASGSPGDNAVARAIGDLGTVATLRGGTRSMTQLVAEFSGAVAADTGAARFAVEAGGALVQSLENRRDSVSGVSLDEEAVNLVKYQQAFEAAARVVSITNQMMETLLNEI
jgi:flagellar hook-associated protein 1 FlgK